MIDVDASSLEKLLNDASREGGYVQPTTQDINRAQAVFTKLFAEGVTPKLEAEMKMLGFETVTLELGKRKYLVIKEQTKRQSGRGFYAVRLDKSAPILLQAPHSLSDKYTGHIVAKLMSEGDFAAASWSTVPRRYKDQGKVVDADLAHLDASYFIAFSKAFANHLRNGIVFQMHGFDQKKRKTVAAFSADAILSSGDRKPSKYVPLLKGCMVSKLRKLIPTTASYPDDVRELGALTNTVAQSLRSEGFGGFLHLELVQDVRFGLLHDVVSRKQLGDCLRSLVVGHKHD